MDKREFLKISVFGLGSFFTLPLLGKGKTLTGMPVSKAVEFKLPELQYSYNALEPFIDAETMKLHHLNHHAAYAEKFSEAVKKARINGKNAREILAEVSKYSDEIRSNGGGYLNHKIFWRTLSPSGGGTPKGKLLEDINTRFGSFENFKKEFAQAAINSQGSGWIWLVYTNDRQLKITVTENQDNPMMDIAEVKGKPLLLLDVWEHAYYLKYQNSREEYVSNFWNVVDWKFIEKKYEFFARS